jgi:hypothetical protein
MELTVRFSYTEASLIFQYRLSTIENTLTDITLVLHNYVRQYRNNRSSYGFINDIYAIEMDGGGMYVGNDVINVVDKRTHSSISLIAPRSVLEDIRDHVRIGNSETFETTVIVQDTDGYSNEEEGYGNEGNEGNEGNRYDANNQENYGNTDPIHINNTNTTQGGFRKTYKRKAKAVRTRGKRGTRGARRTKTRS